MWAHTVSTSRLNGLLVADPKFPPSVLFDDLTLISTRSEALHVKSATSAGHKVCVRRLEQTDKASPAPVCTFAVFMDFDLSSFLPAPSWRYSNSSNFIAISPRGHACAQALCTYLICTLYSATSYVLRTLNSTQLHSDVHCGPQIRPICPALGYEKPKR